MFTRSQRLTSPSPTAPGRCSAAEQQLDSPSACPEAGRDKGKAWRTILPLRLSAVCYNPSGQTSIGCERSRHMVSTLVVCCAFSRRLEGHVLPGAWSDLKGLRTIFSCQNVCGKSLPSPLSRGRAISSEPSRDTIGIPGNPVDS